jgi:hypothetical protein
MIVRGSARLSRPTRARGWALLLSLLLAGCGSTPSPTPSPAPTPTPAPTSTPTPLPPIPLTIHWPEAASALEAVTAQVELPHLEERDPAARVRAVVSDPLRRFWWRSDLEPVGDGFYAASLPLYLPLEPLPGDWRLIVIVSTAAKVSGETMLRFRPAAVPLHDLGDQIPAGVTLHVPQALPVVRAEGDQVAGSLVWAEAGGEVGLWWVPGPDEPLSQDTAQVMVEATYPGDDAVEVVNFEPTEWHERPAFHLLERWPEGPAEVLVLQGPDRWLYLLRVRALDGEMISPLLWDIQATLRVEE